MMLVAIFQRQIQNFCPYTVFLLCHTSIEVAHGQSAKSVPFSFVLEKKFQKKSLAEMQSIMNLCNMKKAERESPIQKKFCTGLFIIKILNASYRCRRILS